MRTELYCNNNELFRHNNSNISHLKRYKIKPRYLYHRKTASEKFWICKHLCLVIIPSTIAFQLLIFRLLCSLWSFPKIWFIHPYQILRDQAHHTGLATIKMTGAICYPQEVNLRVFKVAFSRIRPSPSTELLWTNTSLQMGMFSISCSVRPSSVRRSLVRSRGTRGSMKCMLTTSSDHQKWEISSRFMMENNT